MTDGRRLARRRAHAEHYTGFAAAALWVVPVATTCDAVAQPELFPSLSPPCCIKHTYQPPPQARGVSRELFRDVGPLVFKRADSGARLSWRSLHTTARIPRAVGGAGAAAELPGGPRALLRRHHPPPPVGSPGETQHQREGGKFRGGKWPSRGPTAHTRECKVQSLQGNLQRIHKASLESMSV